MSAPLIAVFATLATLAALALVGGIVWRVVAVRRFRARCRNYIAALARHAKAVAECECPACAQVAEAIIGAAERAAAVFLTVGAWHMCWRFWRPLAAFYPGQPWAQPMGLLRIPLNPEVQP